MAPYQVLISLVLTTLMLGGVVQAQDRTDTLGIVSKTVETKAMQQKETDTQFSDDKKNAIGQAPAPGVEGSIVHYPSFESDLIRPRPVDVWLPEGYDPEAKDQYPVIYMHDGQMLFNHSLSSFVGMDVFWDVDKAMTRLVNQGEIRPAIVVAVWMASWDKGARGAEYMPQKAVTSDVWARMNQDGPGTATGGFAGETGGQTMSSDNYLKFLVTELKPFIDDNYRTLPDREHTFLMGSSMGGLISAYAISEYPEVFGAAACLSTHWPIGLGAVVEWFDDHWPAAGSHRLYFDYGTETLDARYEPYQQQMDAVMRKYGYTQDDDWVTLRFEGEDHTPRAWRERLHIPLDFLLGPR